MDTYERLTKTKELAAYLQSYIIIKGSWSTVVTPEGNCYFNPTGNPVSYTHLDVYKRQLHSYLFLCLLASFLRNSAFILAAPDPCNPFI